MQAVILAAGRGTRLGNITRTRPKGLIEVGGKSLLARSLDCLAAAGVATAVLVTGYKGPMIARTLGNQHAGMRLRYIENPKFATTGSMVSLYLARPAVTKGPLLVLESDLLYDPRFVTAALRARGTVLMAAAATGSGDEVYLCVKNGTRLDYLGKAAGAGERARAVGEFAGISRLSGAFFARFCAEVEQALARGAAGDHYEEVFWRLAQRGARVRVEAHRDWPWTEVDTPSDLARARTRIWPRIKAMTEETP